MMNAFFRICPTWLEYKLTSLYFRARSISTNGFLAGSVKHSNTLLINHNKMKIQVLPALEDNYMYLIIDEATREAAIVDPVDPDSVEAAVKENNANLTKVLTTHHHWDHAGGNENLCKKFQNLQVYGGDDRIGALTSKVKHDDVINIGGIKVVCLETPCHTSGHICYYIPEKDGNSPAVFTGDTLFLAGCGKFFEGTAEQMHKALIQILGKLPDETKVYCGHEYTANNLKFAVTIEPENEAILKKIEWVREQRAKSQPTVPSTIFDEKRTNPFMRVQEETVKKQTKLEDPIAVMGSLRKQKDSFKG